ncbi:ankyrin repeat domain-containing protein [Pontiella sp.]|uniref:ankyrin repeat domain-containing protein n=1 Tax=Pontiella sp. TaxID=2837462 RepID=UPI0035681B68
MSMIRIFAAVAMASALLNVNAETTNQVAAITQQEVVEAALYGKIDVVEKALAQGYAVNARDPENRTVLMYAAFNGQTDVIKKLIDAKADVNAQDNIGTSPLMFAASAPNGAASVQVLLDAGAKINMVDNNEHFSALMWAAAEGQAENVKLLLANKADATLQDVDGDTAESFAAKAGHYDVVRILKAAAPKKETAEQKAE